MSEIKCRRIAEMRILEWFCLDKDERKNFFWLLLAYGLYVFPLILANTYYLDDIGRTVNGYAAWENDGRPFSMLVFDLLNFQWTFHDGIVTTAGGILHPIQDLAPYPLLLGIAIFAYVVVLLSRKYLRTKSLLILIGCQALCIMNPFMIGGIVYRFDCIMMLLAVSSMLLCFALPEGLSWKKLFWWSFVLSFLVLCLYQAMIGACIALTALEILVCIYRVERVQAAVYRCAVRLTGFFISGILYKFTVAAFLVKSYNYELQTFVSPFSRHSWDVIRQNIHTYHALLRSYTDVLPWVVGGAMLLMFLLFSWRWLHRAAGSPAKKFFVYAGGVLVVVFGAYAPLVLLQAPANHARELIFLVVIPLALGIMTCALAESRRVLAFLLVPLLMYGFYYIYSFGNVLKHQAEWENMIVQQISYDIGRLKYEGSHPGRTAHPPTIAIVGDAPPSLEFQIAVRRQPLMANILESCLLENHNGCVLLRHYVPFDFTMGVNEEIEKGRSYAASHDPVLSNTLYAIYLHDDHIIVKFQ